jgi:phospholipid/cholesterol/gamma-HCH transport system substrate-binding protein
MKISKYTRLGLLIVISVTILIWGLSYLKGNDIFKRNDYYHVVYDRIEGLTESNKVTLNGYQVGHVKEIRFTSDNSGKLLVTLLIDASFRIPVNSVAQIVSSDIMGTRSVKLILSEEKEVYLSNDTIPGAVEGDLKEQVSMQVLPIKNKAEQLLSTIDSAITILTVIFNEDARENLSESFANINRTIDNLEKTSASLNEIVSSEKDNIQRIIINIDQITTAFKNNTENLEKTIKNLSAFSDTLSQISVTPMLDNLADASKQILSTLEKINSSDNTAGLLLNDDQLYLSLNTMTENLGSLIKDIETNPKRYLHFSAFDFGKEVYITTSGEAISGNIQFKVHLVSTENQVSLNSKLFEGLGEVEEYIASGAYTYLAGNSNSYTEIVKLHDRSKKVFPDATIVAFKNGRLIKLEKALKSTR